MPSENRNYALLAVSLLRSYQSVKQFPTLYGNRRFIIIINWFLC